MKKSILALALCVLLLTLAASALAEYSYGSAMIDGKNADRVNLRTGAGREYASIGLYFTGTQVTLLSDMYGDWTLVQIGTQSGYIMTEYLTTGWVTPRQPTAYPSTIEPGDTLSVYQIPQDRAIIAADIPYGESVTVLGETSDSWYYVQYGGAFGYVRAQYLSLSGSSGGGGNHGTAYVRGSSDRVHLRRGPGANYDSLGLYFTGTQVTLLSSLHDTWVRVRIGEQSGYMMSKYLSSRAVNALQPRGTIHVRSGSVHLRKAPEGDVIGELYEDAQLTVLGETSDGWYYVDTGNRKGYVSSKYVKVYY